MGVLKGLGKAGLGLLENIGSAGMWTATKAIPKVAEGIATPTAHFLKKDTANFIGAIGVGLGAGAIIGDNTEEGPAKGALTLGTGAFIASSLGGAGAITTLGASAIATGVTMGGIAAKAGEKMIKMPKDGVKLGLDNLDEIKMSGLGKAMLIGGALMASPLKAYNAFEKSRMGTNDGVMRSATPMMPSLDNKNVNSIDYSNTGATGDLVFAMYNNR